MVVIGQHHNLDVLPPGKNPGFHCIWRWVGPKAGLGVLDKRKVPWSCWDSNAILSSTHASHFTDYAILASIQTFWTCIIIRSAHLSYPHKTLTDMCLVGGNTWTPTQCSQIPRLSCTSSYSYPHSLVLWYTSYLETHSIQTCQAVIWYSYLPMTEKTTMPANMDVKQFVSDTITASR